jgi:pimeloyl-ACP methyl ester carboxylesterase
LHRVVKEGINPKGVVFILPGTWSTGEQLCSNPPDDNWTADEDHSFALFLANRGFDVYAIDYRTHFVPIYFTHGDLSFMVDWGWDAWIGDIKKGVELAKEVSRVRKLFIAGDSFGGSAAMNYASLHWQEDLKGILLRDGGTGAKYPELVTNSYNLPAMIYAIESTGYCYWEVGSAPGSIFILRYADENPGAPAINPLTLEPLEPTTNPFTGLPWANILEWAAFAIYMAWGPGVVSNIYGGFGDPRVMLHIDATFDRYWPLRLGLESEAISDWNDCPDVTYDFDDHYHEIDVPLLAFTSELFGRNYWGNFTHWIANPDFKGHYLDGYGHLDVYSGEYSKQDVSQPTYEWLMSHSMLEGCGSIKFENKWYMGKTTIFINGSVIDFKINDKRFSWDIIYHYSSRRYEIFIGLSDLGSIKILITKFGFATAIGWRVFFFGCKM